MPARFRATAPTYHTTMSTIGPGWTPADLRHMASERQAQRQAQGLGMSAQDVTQFAARIASSAATSAVRQVRIESQITPSYTYSPGAGGRADPARPGVTDWIMRNVVKPVVVIDTPAGAQVYAPYGMPTVNLFWPLVGLAAGGAALVTVLALRGVRAPKVARNPRPKKTRLSKKRRLQVRRKKKQVAAGRY